MIRTETCPACANAARDAQTIYERSRDALVRCPHCRSLFSNPRYTPDELAELYRQEYYDEQVGAEQERWAGQQGAAVLHRTLLGVLGRRYPGVVRPGAAVLDYGCGLGFFLAEAKRVGLVPTGIELSDVAAAHARDTLGLDVRCGTEDALDALDDGAFDLVTANAVIEHVIEPRRTLRLLIDKLRPGGVLVISLPNLACWRCRLEGGKWFNLANPTHLTFFTHAAIRATLHELGMNNVRRPVYWGGRPGFGPVRNAAQYIARALNLGADLRLFARKAPGRAADPALT